MNALTLKVGDEAPPFAAHDCDGKALALEEFRGKKKVVLFFFPRAFTVRCEEEVRNFRDHYERIVQAGGELVGVSTDRSERQCEFKAAEKLQFRLIGDDAHVLSKLYGVEWIEMKASRRVTFVIDEAGKIIELVDQEYAIDQHLNGVLAALDA